MKTPWQGSLSLHAHKHTHTMHTQTHTKHTCIHIHVHVHTHTQTHRHTHKCTHMHTKLCTYMTLICSGPHTPSSTEGVTTPQYPCLRLVAAIQSTWRTGGLCHCGPKTVKWGLEHDAYRLRYICTKQMQKTNVAHMFDSREVLCSSSSLNYKQNSSVSLGRLGERWAITLFRYQLISMW